MTKIIRRFLRRPDSTPTLVNLAEGQQDGWVTLPAWEVEDLACTRVLFIRGREVYATNKRI